MIGVPVLHKTFGAGTVIEQEHTTITVKFQFGNKRFIMPSAFTDGFLKTADTEINRRLSQYQDMGKQIRLAKNNISAANRSMQVLEKK